jgi:DNA-binding beta-propeller fold protein YncE
LEAIIELDRSAMRKGAGMRRWLGVTEIPQSFRRPYGVTWRDGDLVVADPGSGRVARIAPTGKISYSERGLFRQPIGVAVCDEALVVSDAEAGRVALLDGQLRLLRWLVEDVQRPTGLACRDGRVYVVETGRHRILVLKDGEVEVLGERGAGPGEFNFPTSLTTDGESLWVGDALNFRVQRIDPEDGSPLGDFGRVGDAPGETPRIKGVAVDRNGHLWVSDGYLDRVSLYDPRGRLLISIGSTGSGEGEFSFPAGIAAHPDGRVAVVDSFNRRLQIFQVLDGEPGEAGSADERW